MNNFMGEKKNSEGLMVTAGVPKTELNYFNTKRCFLVQYFFSLSLEDRSSASDITTQSNYFKGLQTNRSCNYKDNRQSLHISGFGGKGICISY